jgi:toxin ParE1/3/4
VSILRRDAALHDLIDLAYYIALDNVEAAYQFLDQAEESFRDLERMPLMGSAREFQDSTLTGIRMWRVKDFPKNLIFYRPIKDGVEIIRVLHSSRDIAGLFAEDE